MNIEEGKYYITRDGRKVGPMKPSGYDDWPWIVVRGDCQCWDHNGVGISGTDSPDLVAEWTDGPKLWRDMTPEEKGALLLAHHEGKMIEMGSHIPGTSRLVWSECPSNWKPISNAIYRIKPVRETVEMRSEGSPTNRWCFCTDIHLPYDTHRITFDTIDGEPDTTSIKMEKL